MRKPTNEIRTGGAVVHLDAEEVSALLCGVALANREWVRKALQFEEHKLEGWRAEASLCRAAAEACESVELKLLALPQYTLPLDWRKRSVAAIASVLVALAFTSCGSTVALQWTFPRPDSLSEESSHLLRSNTGKGGRP